MCRCVGVSVCVCVCIKLLQMNEQWQGTASGYHEEGHDGEAEGQEYMSPLLNHELNRRLHTVCARVYVFVNECICVCVCVCVCA
jgi:hypothetical protein